MHITYDTAKNAVNLTKHGVSLAVANQLEWDLLQAMPDSRMDYGEPRMIGYAPITERVYCVVFVDRDEANQVLTRRVISLCKANMREVKAYVNQI